MRPMFSGLLVGFLSLFTSSYSWAHPAIPSGYLGINWAQFSQRPDPALQGFNQGRRFETDDLQLRLGGRIAPNFASELRAGTSLVEHKDATGASYKNRYYGSYVLRTHLTLWRFQPYLAANYSYGERELSSLGSGRLSGFGYAAGVDIKVFGPVGINLEYARPYATEKLDPQVLSGGILWSF